ncbi:6-phosphofructokinase [Veillonella sp. R32]|uniref:6-phosphofructokinase n=1 Tax=Veillonella sp. R32 TaxID=2021312 RepID=UPI001389D8A5|nr:6-phosphofructokinase [Veillonella sp. R32]KAF1683403.1 6-phosphofructokinase [Veillonella sp. R32]
MKKIAILTSGGDAPGMNAAVRALVRKGIYEGFEVYGIHRGYEGLLKGDFQLLDRRDVGGIVNKGGTLLKTARCIEFAELPQQVKAARILREQGIEALVVIGGDGSMAGAMALSKQGIPTLTIPGTIDNDMCGTEYTIGFDTALNTVVDAVSKIRDTTTAHDRVAIVEVMGRHAGHLAVRAGLACGAEMVLIPEKPMSLENVCKHLRESYAAGKTNSIIMVAEGAYHSFEVYSYINKTMQISPSVTVLGYLQRGGAPSARDASMAALMSERAIDALKGGTYNCLIGFAGASIEAIPYEEALQRRYPISEEEYELISVLAR